MQIYLVGGAVRDALLGLSVKDRDFVVVGATPEQLKKQGFIQVGKDFPVFLHPKTKEEYALARTEKKQGHGYKGFKVNFSPDTSLEEDLSRRDLTINAIAQSENGIYIDPFNGQADLKKRILRHVSPAFVEDPLRVLRVARFAARFHHLGFNIAQETLDLMREITKHNELQTLTAERIWLETEKALYEPHPEIYFLVLRTIGALNIIFPEIDALFGKPSPTKNHPEIDAGIHTLMVLQQATHISAQASLPIIPLRFAALCHDIGKGIIPYGQRGHESAGVPLVESLCLRLKVPEKIKHIAKLCCQYHSHIHHAFQLEETDILNLFNKLDAWRKPENLSILLAVSFADSGGR